MARQEDRLDEFAELLEGRLGRLGRRLAGYRRSDTWLPVASIVLSALATMLAGAVAVEGADLAGQAGGWRAVCSAVAVLTGLATLSSGLHKQLGVAHKLSEATNCSARLNALRFSLGGPEPDLEELRREYREVLEQYHAYLA